jgi:hypothetical protein
VLGYYLLLVLVVGQWGDAVPAASGRTCVPPEGPKGPKQKRKALRPLPACARCSGMPGRWAREELICGLSGTRGTLVKPTCAPRPTGRACKTHRRASAGSTRTAHFPIYHETSYFGRAGGEGERGGRGERPTHLLWGIGRKARKPPSCVSDLWGWARGGERGRRPGALPKEAKIKNKTGSQALCFFP